MSWVLKGNTQKKTKVFTILMEQQKKKREIILSCSIRTPELPKEIEPLLTGLFILPYTTLDQWNQFTHPAANHFVLSDWIIVHACVNQIKVYR